MVTFLTGMVCFIVLIRFHGGFLQACRHFVQRSEHLQVSLTATILTLKFRLKFLRRPLSTPPLSYSRTCSTFTEKGGSCVGLEYFPNATVAEYGTIENGQTGDNEGRAMKIRKEIYTRGKSNGFVPDKILSSHALDLTQSIHRPRRCHNQCHTPS